MNRAFAEKLDTIMHGLLAFRYKAVKGENVDIGDSPSRLDFICNNVLNVKDEFEIRRLKEKLLHDNIITEHSNFDLTQTGIEFSTSGGYKRQFDKLVKEDLILDETIKKFKYDKWAFAISVFSFIVALAALILSIDWEHLVFVFKH